MRDALPFSFEVAFLLLVLPIALVWLISVASIAVLAARTTLNTLRGRLRPPASSDDPIQDPRRALQ